MAISKHFIMNEPLVLEDFFSLPVSKLQANTFPRQKCLFKSNEQRVFRHKKDLFTWQPNEHLFCFVENILIWSHETNTKAILLENNGSLPEQMQLKKYPLRPKLLVYKARDKRFVSAKSPCFKATNERNFTQKKRTKLTRTNAAKMIDFHMILTALMTLLPSVNSSERGLRGKLWPPLSL